MKAKSRKFRRKTPKQRAVFLKRGYKTLMLAGKRKFLQKREFWNVPEARINIGITAGSGRLAQVHVEADRNALIVREIGFDIVFQPAWKHDQPPCDWFVADPIPVTLV